jgi:hypothetical protein
LVVAEALNFHLMRKQLLNRYVPSTVIFGHRSISSFAQIMFPKVPGRLWELAADPKPEQNETRTISTASKGF